MHSWRTVVTALMLLWLPLQGLAAVAMPFCKHGLKLSAPAQTTAEAHVHAHPQHAHSGELGSSNLHQHHAAHGTHGDYDSSSGLACNDCGACHLACSPTAPTSRSAANSVGTQTFTPISPTLPPIFIPELDHRPPLAAIA